MLKKAYIIGSKMMLKTTARSTTRRQTMRSTDAGRRNSKSSPFLKALDVFMLTGVLLWSPFLFDRGCETAPFLLLFTLALPCIVIDLSMRLGSWRSLAAATSSSSSMLSKLL